MNWMACEVEFTDEFGAWWDGLTAGEQESLRAYVRVLAEFGVALKHPYCSGVTGSKHSHMRELRVQHQGRPYRVLYAFDPRRAALLLIGGDKTGNDRWYEVVVPIADRIYDTHIAQLRAERKEKDGQEI
jgi:hypothetical protein